MELDPIQGNSIQHAADIGGRNLRSPTSTITSREKGDSVAEEQPPELAQTDSDARIKYIQPNEIIRSEDNPVLSELTGVVTVKTSWPGIDRRSNRVDMDCDSAGQFRTVPHACSYEGVGEHPEVASDILFFPHEDNIQQYRWKTFAKVPPKKPEVRTLRFATFGVERKSLVGARNPRQLSRALVHSLLGWLSTYLSGHLHRDISLGNVLVTNEPVKRKKYEIFEESEDHVHSLQDRQVGKEITISCEQVKPEIVIKPDISDQCIAFVTGRDLTVSPKDYWTKGCRVTKPVTRFLEGHT
ncbi:hypothetical protein BDM02DRAFT_3189948 [Thelephora ganbajun]|uniref:Uncharacterized protein n=1 Tax=Thelephora ganbajun TaxID=370292 RepID=A0ACB6Z7A0_THEGA|nr:hypothetical protein BDM02DRAFT_3189948 [Thelephora ganbajun]